MNRRSFLTVLSSGLVALSVPPIEWVAGVDARVLPESFVAPTLAYTDVGAATTAVLREMVDRRLMQSKWPAQFMAYARHVGDGGLTEQLHCMVDTGIDDEIGFERAIVPIAAALHQQTKSYTRFGALPTESYDCDAAVAIDTRYGLAVRGIKMWSAGDSFLPEGWNWRFGVVAGA